MKIAVALGVVALAFAAVPTADLLTEEYSYADYVAHFRPGFQATHDRFAEREALFKQRLAAAVAHNKAGRSYKKGLNKFSDWTDAERKTFLGRRHMPKPKEGLFSVIETVERNLTIPNIDWRTQGVLTPVKDQASCGGCWAFAATETIEASASITSGKRPIPLAVEQILRCTPNPQQCGGTGGCNGATAELAYSYASNISGLTLDSEYPYTSGSGDTGSCDWNPAVDKPVVAVTGYSVVKENDRASVLAALAKSPVSIGVDASSWFDYESGVFDECNSAATLDLDHAVQLVGYNTDSSGAVSWIVRNSWGPGWGTNGFIYLADTNACVVDPTPGDGSGCKGGPSQVTVCGPCGLFYEVSTPHAKFL